MVYIILLNWKGAVDTLACLESLVQLRGVEYRLVICDNASPDHSYEAIRSGLQNSAHYAALPVVELTRAEAEAYVIAEPQHNALYLIQTGANLGYAGGNNVGIRFALNQHDMQYVWLLNNDTEVTSDALSHMVLRCQSDPSIGICGSRLVYFHDRAHLQGLGGVYNRWLGTTRHYAAYAPSDAIFDDEKVSAEIDYVIGASMLLTRPLLEQVGLLCEEYFLYFEEIDITIQAKRRGMKHSVCSNAFVYHKEGGSTGHCMSKSLFSDHLAIKNRLLFTKKHYQKYFPVVWLGLIGVIFNRIKRKQYQNAVMVLRVMLGR